MAVGTTAVTLKKADHTPATDAKTTSLAFPNCGRGALTPHPRLCENRTMGVGSALAALRLCLDPLRGEHATYSSIHESRFFHTGL